MSDRRVVVVGSLNVDHTVLVERLPAPGATVAGRGYVTAPGGKGLNQAVAAARQGATVELIGAVGDDDAGHVLTGVLVAEGIGRSRVRRRPGPSGTALVTVAADGTNTIVVAPGANGELDTDGLGADGLAGAAVVLCQLEVPTVVVRAALAAGREAGAITVLNPAPASGPLPADLLALVDLVVPNETEAAALTEADPDRTGNRQPGTVTAAAGRAGAALVAAGAGAALVTLGARGALLVPGPGPRGTVDVAPFAVRAVDTTGAGDAFIGALVADLAAGRPLAEAARRGAAAGALAATRPGAVPSLPTRTEVDARTAAGERGQAPA